MSEFTPTQQKILDVLADGLPHTREELHACLDDELSQLGSIHAHLSRLRKKIPEGEDILCVWVDRARKYRRVKLLGSLQPSVNV